MPVGHLHVFFAEMSVWVSSPSFDQVAFFVVVELYDLFIYIGYESLIDHIICKYFLPFSIDCLFILSLACFAVQKLLSLIRPHLFISAFISFALESQGWGSLVGCRLWGRTESDMTEVT